MSVAIKSADDIASMRVAGRLAAEVLDYLKPLVKPGITTGEIDRLAHEYMVDVQRTVPATLEYAPPGHSPYPASLCTSVNHVVCHGIPGARKLKQGDIINVDVTVIKDGYHGDTSRMFFVGAPSIQARRLVDITYEAMWRGIRAVRAGAHLGDIGHAIQAHAESNGFSIVREFCGHGIGRQFHEEPQVLHYGRPGTGLKLQAGMIFTVEPMINAGRAGDSCAGRRLDDRHRRPLAVGAVGAHGPRHGGRLRRADRVGGRAPAAVRLTRTRWPRGCRASTPRRSRRHPRWRAGARRFGPDARHCSRPSSRSPTRLGCSASMRGSSIACCAGSGPKPRCPRALALVAVGGYGRGQLFPHSDVDVLVLLPAGLDAPPSDAIERFLLNLWDVGLEVGHAVRTVDDCVGEMGGDVTVSTSLLEHRLLAGSRRLYATFRERFEAALDPRVFYEAKLLEQQQRHLKHHDAAYNLEPNVKESPGGLRDLQTVVWIARAAGLGRTWRELASHGLVTRREARAVSAARALHRQPAHPAALSRRAARGPPDLRPADRARPRAALRGYRRQACVASS